MNKITSAIQKSTLALLALVSIFLMTSANAVIVNADGIKWDTDGFGDFNAQVSLWTEAVTPGGSLSGYGEVEKINGLNVGDNELTFAFAGINILTIDALGNFTTSGGTVKFYSDASHNFNFLDGSTAIDGTEWLDTIMATSVAGVLVPGPGVTGSTAGSLHAIGGSALAHLDTNTISDGSDLTFDLVTQIITGGLPIPGTNYDRFATGLLAGDSVAVASPTPLALLGAGLLMIGGIARRNQKPVSQNVLVK